MSELVDCINSHRSKYQKRRGTDLNAAEEDIFALLIVLAKRIEDVEDKS